ncbi:MAG: MmgE/PrpD family protein [Clostridia bacterium]|nr:MmgE/PrpD family protein [Clostridia bacterium]
MTILEQLAEYIVHARFTESERKAVFPHITDALLAYLCGHFTSEGRQLISLKSKSSAIIKRDMYTNSLLDDVLISCAITRLTEIDDIHISSCTTPGAVVIPTVKTLISYNEDISVEAISDAIIIGYDVITRLGKTINGPEVLYKGVWPTYFCAAFGTAAITARLLCLSKSETVHALSLALTLSTGGVSQGAKSPFRWFTLGYAARTGCMAAMVGAKGFTGNTEMIEGDWFNRTYGIQSNTTHLLTGLGQENLINSVSMKPYCSAKQALQSIYGLHRILNQGISANEIERVNIYVPPQFATMINHGVTGRLSSLTSVQYQLSLAAYHPASLYDIDRSEIIESQEIMAFMNKVQVFGDSDLAIDYPEVWATRVEVETLTTTVKQFVSESPGDPGMKFNKVDLQNKIQCFIEPILGEGYAQKFIQLDADIAASKESLFKLFNWIEEIIQSDKPKR